MLYFLASVLLVFVSVFPAFARPTIRSVTPNSQGVVQYQKLELKVDLQSSFHNPFDPDDIDLKGIFKSPTGQLHEVNGFVDLPQKRALVDGKEVLTECGPPSWLLRFAPDMQGAWTYQVSVRDRTGADSFPLSKFQCTASKDRRGYIRRSNSSPNLFAYESGAPLVLIGENMAWTFAAGSFQYEKWLDQLSANGGNFIRLWMTYGSEIEGPDEHHGDWRTSGFHGLGVYNLEHAGHLDTILDAAQTRDINVMLCLDSYFQLSTGGFFHEGKWPENPYNAANGGPCHKPEDFWTNSVARKLFRQRLRYIAARYGWRTNLHSWELWNEAANVPPDWVAEMAQYLKGEGRFKGHGADPQRHLVSMTYGSDEIWRLPEVDYTLTHTYGDGGSIADHSPVIHADAIKNANLQKPHLVSEFGIDWRKSDVKYDAVGAGVNMHNGLWSSLASGNAGTSLIWWWDDYVDPLKLYSQFAPVSFFVKMIPWKVGPWHQLKISNLNAPGKQTVSDVTVSSAGGWAPSSTDEFQITETGLAGVEPIVEYLTSTHKGFVPGLTLHVNYAEPGEFIIHVGKASGVNRMRLALDGQTVREVSISAVPPADKSVPAEYKSTELNKQYNVYQADFDKDYAIDVPSGKHVIVLKHLEGDWINIAGIRLTRYSKRPQLNIYGMTNGASAFAWIQNSAHCWKNVSEGKPIPTVTQTKVTMAGLADGTYTLQWFNTWDGKNLTCQSLRTTNGALKINIPDVRSDLALLITPRKN